MIPPIGICIPTYNRADHLSKCLASIALQNMPIGLVQVYISDNASTDNTSEIINLFPELDVRYYRQSENIGSAANFYYLYGTSQYKYIMVVCDDDWLADNCLKHAYDFLERNEDVVMYSTTAAYHDDASGNVISRMRPLLFDASPDNFSSAVKWKNEEFISMCAVQTPVFAGASLIRASAFHIARLGNEEFYYSQEKVLYAKLLKCGSVYFDSRIGIHVRWHKSNLTKSFDPTARDQEFRASTRRVIEIAFEQGIDIPKFWHHRLSSVSKKEKKLILKKLIPGFSRDEIKSIINGDSRAFNDIRRRFRKSTVDDTYPDDAVLAIFTPNIGTHSETFIKRHIQHISPGRTVVVTSNVYDKTWINCPYLVIPGSEGPKTYFSIVEKIVTDFLRYHKVTHILCEYGCFLTEIVELNHRVLKLPIFIHFFGGDASEFLRNPRIVNYYRWMGQQVTGVIAIAKPMADRLEHIGIPKEKISIVHLGIEIPEAINSEPEIEPCRFISVTRFVPKKGILYTLMAFARAASIVPGLKLEIIGGDGIPNGGRGQMYQKVLDFVAANHLQNSVSLHGGQPFEYVQRLLHASSVYVQHSITDSLTGDAEGLPIIIMEASAAGLPILSTRHEGIPEEVEHGVTGFLVDEFNVEKMAEYMVLLATNPKMRKEMGLSAHKKILDEFSLPSSIENLRKILGIAPGYHTCSFGALGISQINWFDAYNSLRLRLYATGLAICINAIRVIGLSAVIGNLLKKLGITRS